MAAREAHQREVKLLTLCALESHDWNRAKEDNQRALEQLLKQIADEASEAARKDAKMSPKQAFHKEMEAREHPMTREGETPISLAAASGLISDSEGLLLSSLSRVSIYVPIVRSSSSDVSNYHRQHGCVALVDQQWIHDRHHK